MEMYTSNITFYITLPVCIALVFWYLIRYSPDTPICHKDYGGSGRIICHPACPPRHFSLPGNSVCERWLTCSDMHSVHFKKGKLIGKGAVKMVYLAEWKGHTIVLNSLANVAYEKDFLHGFSMLTAFQGYQYVTQLLGSCDNNYFTEYHKFGSAKNIDNILQQARYRELNNIETRLGLCMNYAEIINYFHNSPIGTRVMCDSNYLEKTLSQYLLRMDLTLIANDLDALPKTNRSAGLLIRCGRQRIYGDFPAPEQLWPYEDNSTDPEMLPPYDEKTDIWKIPDVCSFFLDSVPGSDGVRFHLFKIHRQCKEDKPALRPTAKAILEKYQEVYKELIS